MVRHYRASGKDGVAARFTVNDENLNSLAKGPQATTAGVINHAKSCSNAGCGTKRSRVEKL